MTWLKLLFAGSESLLWHWGLGVGIIILCLAGAFLSQVIPIIGPWLGPWRKDLEWIAAAVAVFLMAEAIGVHDEAKRCQAKAIVIEKVVTKAVQGAQTPQAQKQTDPYDQPGN